MIEKRKPFDLTEDATQHLDVGSKLEMKLSMKECKIGTLYSSLNISTLSGYIQQHPSPNELRFQLILHSKLLNPFSSEIYLSKDVPNCLPLARADENTVREEEKEGIDSSNKSNFDENVNSQQCSKRSVSKMNSPLKSIKSKTEQSFLQSDVEIGQVILRAIEVIGINIELFSLMNILCQLSLTQQLNESIQTMLKNKSEYFEKMMRKVPSEEDSYDCYQTPFNFSKQQDNSYFSSIYDTTILQVYEEFSNVQWSESSASLKTITSILSKIDQTIKGSSVELQEISEEDKIKLLTRKELNNLTELQKKMEQNKEWLSEKLKIVSERKYFNLNEVVSIPKDKIDEIHFVQLTHFQYFDEKLIQHILFSICGIANSKGGQLFIGIHNIYGRVSGISLREVTHHQIISEIRRTSQLISPSLEIEDRIIHVLEQPKEMPKQKVVIRIDIPARQKNTIYFCPKNSSHQACFIKQNGYSLMIQEDQLRQLTAMRSLEEDTPNLEDYLDLLPTRERSSRKSFSESGQSSLDNILKEFPLDPNLPNTWILNSKKHFLDSSKEPKQFSKENNSQQQAKGLLEEEKTHSILNSHRSNSFLAYSSFKKPENTHTRELISRGQSKFRNNFTQNFNHSSNSRENSMNRGAGIEQNKNQVGQNGRNNFKMNSDHRGIKEKPSTTISRQAEIARRISAVNSNISFKVFEAWRKKRLVDYFKRNENYLTITDFRQQILTQTNLDQLDSLTPSTCYLIYNIQEQKLKRFKEQLSKSLRQSNVNEFEFLGEVEYLTVIKIDRDSISPARLDRIINPEVVNFSMRCFVMHGFTFEYLELRECFNNSVSICILEFVFKLIQVKYELKLSQGKLSLHFSTFMDFAFAYSTLKNIKSVFEETIDSCKVKIFFNITKPSQF